MSRKDAFRCHVAQAFMIPPCVVVVDEVAELPFKVARQIVVFEHDAVFERAMPACLASAGGKACRASAGCRCLQASPSAPTRRSKGRCRLRDAACAGR